MNNYKFPELDFTSYEHFMSDSLLKLIKEMQMMVGIQATKVSDLSFTINSETEKKKPLIADDEWNNLIQTLEENKCQ